MFGRLLRLLPTLVLVQLLALACLFQLIGVVTVFPVAVDIDIPLQAAQRWVDGQAPYLASAFAVTSGRGFPFLYPPYVLPLVAPLTLLPKGVVFALWDVACLAASLLALDRLAIPRRFWPALIVWPPFTEPIWNGNVQVMLAAAFTFAFWKRERRGDWLPVERSLHETGLGARSGILATVVGAVKASQVHAWLLTARWDRRGAAIGAAVLVAFVVATLPLTGIGLYLEWLDQARRAMDPAWKEIGWPLSLYLPAPISTAIIIGSLLAVPLLPRRDAAVWTGMLLVLGSPAVHNFTWLFGLPALLRVRREIALLIALAWTTYRPEFEWPAFALLGLCLLGSYRWRFLAAPSGAPREGTAKDALPVTAA